MTEQKTYLGAVDGWIIERRNGQTYLGTVDGRALFGFGAPAIFDDHEAAVRRLRGITASEPYDAFWVRRR